MKKVRHVLIVIAGVLIIIQIIDIDFQELSWANNRSNYLGILGLAIIIAGLIYSNWYDFKKNKR